MQLDPDTIAAIATPPGNGGIGVIRISGSKTKQIAGQLLKKKLISRNAQYCEFFDAQNRVIDTGISLYFQAPASYTGEDVLELQGHGGAVVLNMLLNRVVSLGARLARPGEFTERAFLNGKLDLAQAEAVADLIQAGTEQSARSAQQSMQGVFSAQVNVLVDELTALRVFVEAAIDFVDEDIDFLSEGIVATRIADMLQQLDDILQIAQQGKLLRDGMSLVLAGKPNAGKSSLLNALAGYNAAIVTDIAGTTRDVLREQIQLDGLPLHIIDTAGLHDSHHVVEQEGIRRARAEMAKADKILFLLDSREGLDHGLLASLPANIETIKIFNKIDLLGGVPHIEQDSQGTCIYLSVKTGAGFDLLTRYLKQSVGYYTSGADSVFMARGRHIEALQRAKEFVRQALGQAENGAGELAAEDLRQAQHCLGEITGKISSDELLGKIFANFCIGK